MNEVDAVDAVAANKEILIFHAGEVCSVQMEKVMALFAAAEQEWIAAYLQEVSVSEFLALFAAEAVAV